MIISFVSSTGLWVEAKPKNVTGMEYTEVNNQYGFNQWEVPKQINLKTAELCIEGTPL